MVILLVWMLHRKFYFHTIFVSISKQHEGIISTRTHKNIKFYAKTTLNTTWYSFMVHSFNDAHYVLNDNMMRDNSVGKWEKNHEAK